MKTFFYWIVIILVFFILFLYIIGYNSGLCKINKKYTCEKKFCLYKQFSFYFPANISKDLQKLIQNKRIQKRVNVQTFPETILNCALPNKKGVAITCQSILDITPQVISFYQNELCQYISKLINVQLYPTELKIPTCCCIIIYEKEGDWINWHYDYNYYKGRFFTVLIPISNNMTCTEFQLMDNNNNVKSIHLLNHNSIVFEGNYLYHRATKLCENQKRILLSCQYVTDNTISDWDRFRSKFRDFAFTGKISIRN